MSTMFTPSAEATQTLSFEAEVKQLLHLVTHALYSNKEIFLRELISNASDAADKLRYEALSNNSLYENDPELKIWIDYDESAQTITLRDNGIGMTRDEIIENLGTIAQSGTRKFKELLTHNKEATQNSQLIGQFGVGFYSAFVVADRVIVHTRRAGAPVNAGVYWESTGEGEFTVKNISKTDRGTEVILHLRSDATEFLNRMRLQSIIRKYSDHIVLPILMKAPEEEKNEGKNEEKNQEGDNPQTVDHVEETPSESESPTYEAVNRANALWTLSRTEITDSQYTELYKHIAHDFEDPLTWTHNKVEGKLEYTSLLYIPARAPFDLWNRDALRGLKLYVKRVFIMDDAEHLMPLYMRFVKGIVDSNDLPLNISREILQSNEMIEQIKSGCVKRILSLLENLAENEKEKYQKFWNQFGQVLKEGPAEDYANKDRIAKLLRFSSTHSGQAEQDVSLTEYLSRMQPGQDKIYYVTADTFISAQNSPLLEVFRKKNIEVLLLHDKIDEWLVSHLMEFEGKSLQSIAKGSLDLGSLDDEAGKEEAKEKEKEYEDYLKKMKEILKEDVKDVRLTHRLVNSPSCVVFDENELSGHMQRILAQAGQGFPSSKPILELNPSHLLVKKIKDEPDETRFAQWAQLLLSQALLAEGEQLKNPAEFVKNLNDLLLSF